MPGTPKTESHEDASDNNPEKSGARHKLNQKAGNFSFLRFHKG